MKKLHPKNVDPTMMTDEEYYIWLMGVWGDESGQPDPTRWLADMCKLLHTKVQELKTQLELASLDGPL